VAAGFGKMRSGGKAMKSDQFEERGGGLRDQLRIKSLPSRKRGNSKEERRKRKR